MSGALRSVRSERDDRVLETHEHKPGTVVVQWLRDGHRTEYRFCSVPNCNELLRGNFKRGELE